MMVKDENKEKIIDASIIFKYKLGEEKRPHLKKKQKALFYLYNNTFLGLFGFFKRCLIKACNLPDDLSIARGFFCTDTSLLSIGRNVGLGDTFIIAYAPIYIGKGCSFSFKNMIITSTHDINDYSTVLAKPVIIKDHVWITSNVTILPGVTIGENTIIAAGSVVTKDIPAGVLAGGNPCHVIREISFIKNE